MATILDQLEAEAVHVLRNVYARFERPVLLFSGGKDSTVLAHLAAKAFAPGDIPLPFLHIDTGHNFAETIAFRDDLVERLGVTLIVASVEEAIEQGVVPPADFRNRLQSTVLQNAIESHAFDAAIGGARRDEEKARAKERVFSLRRAGGRWEPERQRPEIWQMCNHYMDPGEHVRVFPLSNWTERHVWQYIQRENIDVLPLYFMHERLCVRRGGAWIACTEHVSLAADETAVQRRVRARTVGDVTCTGFIVSEARTIEDIVVEIEDLETGERGQRVDDQSSDAAMEERKREGYF